MKYMIRKPEYIKDAAGSRFFPNTAIALLITLAVFGAFFLVSLIAGAIYAAAAGRMEPEKLAEILTSQDVIVFSLYFEALLIALTLIYVRFIEKRPLRSIGLTRRGFAARYAAGFGMGFALLAVYVAPVLLSAPVRYNGITWLVAVYLGAFAVQSAAEEVLFRGYIMSALLRRGGAMQALLISTTLFALFHIPGSSLSAADLLLIFLLGAVFGLYTLRTGSLWGAMGLHAAWNFFTGCATPVPLGPFQIGYSVLSSDVTPEQGAVSYLVAIIMFLAAIALLLFMGKNKLITERTREQDMLDNALVIAKRTMRGYGEFRRYALRVAETANGESKHAALLHYAVRCGYPLDMVKYYASPGVAAAVDALMPRASDQPNEYFERVARDPIASGVKAAEQKLADIMTARQARREGLNEY